VELAELRKGAVPLDENILAWAAAQKLFDDEEGKDDWVRFHALWTQLRILTGRPRKRSPRCGRRNAKVSFSRRTRKSSGGWR